MRRLIYDMYYAEEISIDIAIKLLDKLTQIRDKKRYQNEINRQSKTRDIRGIRRRTLN